MYIPILVIAVLLSLYIAWSSLAPVNKIANLRPGQSFLEMGCGNGRVCAYIAKMNPSVKVTGIELAIIFYLFTKLRVILFGPKNLKIVFADALKYNISNFDVIYVFGLIDTVNTKIKKKIMEEMSKNGKLISYMFAMKQWDGESIKHKENDKTAGIYVYIKSD